MHARRPSPLPITPRMLEGPPPLPITPREKIKSSVRHCVMSSGSNFYDVNLRSNCILLNRKEILKVCTGFLSRVDVRYVFFTLICQQSSWLRIYCTTFIKNIMMVLNKI